MKPVVVMPWGAWKGATLDRLPSAYLLSLIAPDRLRVALPRELESALNAEWARRRKAELQVRRTERRAA